MPIIKIHRVSEYENRLRKIKILVDRAKSKNW
mgnify:CR=1 FL=1